MSLRIFGTMRWCLPKYRWRFSIVHFPGNSPYAYFNVNVYIFWRWIVCSISKHPLTQYWQCPNCVMCLFYKHDLYYISICLKMCYARFLMERLIYAKVSDFIIYDSRILYCLSLSVTLEYLCKIYLHDIYNISIVLYI